MQLIKDAETDLYRVFFYYDSSRYKHSCYVVRINDEENDNREYWSGDDEHEGRRQWGIAVAAMIRKHVKTA